MRKPSRLFEAVLKRLISLNEAACPTCGTEGAYVGFSDVECPNPSCVHYLKPAATNDSEKQKYLDFWGLYGYHNNPSWRTNVTDILIDDYNFIETGDIADHYVSPEHWRVESVLVPGEEDITVNVSNNSFGYGGDVFLKAISQKSKDLVRNLYNTHYRQYFSKSGAIDDLTTFQSVFDARHDDPNKPNEYDQDKIKQLFKTS